MFHKYIYIYISKSYHNTKTINDSLDNLLTLKSPSSIKTHKV